MNIKLIWLHLTNFKGTRDFKASFGILSTNVFGDNQTGKTTLFDAFLWLLFGKDSTDRKDFGWKPLDNENNEFHKLITSVEGCFIIDGVEHIIRREMREKWQKKRGTTVEEFTGHETSYYWDDVPMAQNEYQAKIGSYLQESTFKLITNTTYFNSMKWQDRRAVLMQLAGRIDEQQIISSLTITPEHKEMLLQAVATGKHKENFKAYRAEVAAKRLKIKNELDLMPSRIEEAEMAVPDEKDFSELEKTLEEVKSDIQNVETLLSSKSEAYKQHQESVMALMNQRQKKQQQQKQIEFEVRQQVQKAGNERAAVITAKENELNIKHTAKDELLRQYIAAETERKNLEAQKEQISNQWVEENGRQLEFKENEFCCPTCKREFDAEVVESKKTDLTNNFNKNKADTLTILTGKGTKLADQINSLNVKKGNVKAQGDALNLEIAALQDELKELKEEHARLSNAELENEQFLNTVETNAEWTALRNEISSLTQQIDQPYTADDNSALLQRKSELNSQKDQLIYELAGKGAREKQIARVVELKDKESKMAAEVALYEGIEFSIAAYVKASMTMVENTVNSKFKLVRFKMFEEQINGGETETCITLVNGVPYPDVNTAGKIQAGIDIINTLTEHYGIKAPVWVDNRESVVLLPETDCQLINLIVSEQDKKLRVVTQDKIGTVAA